MYYVYILQSKRDRSHYVGTTKDLRKRVQEHNRGEVRFTAPKVPYVLVWYCAFPTKKQALDFERYLKSGSGIAFAQKRLLPPKLK